MSFCVCFSFFYAAFSILTLKEKLNCIKMRYLALMVCVTCSKDNCIFIGDSDSDTAVKTVVSLFRLELMVKLILADKVFFFICKKILVLIIN